MRVFIFLFASLFIAIGSFAQTEGEMKKSGNYLVPNEFLDPNYPDVDESVKNGKSSDEAILELRIYSKNLGRFPVFVSTGNPVQDKLDYEYEIAYFFEKHPYFPQEIYTGNAEKDAQNFEFWYKAWVINFPEKAKKVQPIDMEGGIK